MYIIPNMKIIENKLDESRMYRAREIAEQGWIKNTLYSDNESSNYQYVLSLIKNGTLHAVNHNPDGKRPLWLVSGKEIKRYLNDLNKY